MLYFRMHKESKPRLYHASSNRDIKIFEPRQESVRDQNAIGRMHKSRDHGYSVVYEMQRKGLSENQKLGKNVVFLE